MIVGFARLAIKPVMSAVTKQGAEHTAKNVMDQALKDLVGKSADKLLGKKGNDMLRTALKELADVGGMDVLKKGLNFLDKGLGSEVKSALEALQKTGKFEDLSPTQMGALGKGLLKLGGYLI